MFKGFEGMLARKYIAAQKRHSALTICSIAIALALISTLFSLFSTVTAYMRALAMDEGDYHIKIVGTGQGLTQEEYDTIADFVSEYGTCKPEKVWISGNECYWANIKLDKSIDSAKLFVERIERKLGIKPDPFGHSKKLGYWTNDILMMLELKDDQSKLFMAAYIAGFYVFVLFFIMMLRLIIDTAFEVSSKERERQLGVLQSVGATPKQIVRIITCEGLLLSVIGIPIGTAVGIGLGYLVYRAVLGTGLFDLYLSPAKAAELVHFSVNPWLMLLGVVTGLVWVLLSAYGTGMRIIKRTPVEAISGRANEVKKVSRSPMLGRIFGWTGKLASRSNKRQPKRFAAAVISLTLSIALFSAVTVVVSDLRGAADKYYEEYGAKSDFRVYLYNTSTAEDVALNDKVLNTIEKSGLFEAVSLSISIYAYNAPSVGNIPSDNCVVRFLNRAEYNESFEGNPPISYDELAKSGKFIAAYEILEGLNPDNTVTLTFYESEEVRISEEEYNALSPEEQEIYKNMTRIDGVTTYSYNPEHTMELAINPDVTAFGRRNIIATYDQYKNSDFWRYNDKFSNIAYCSLADTERHYEAIDFFEENSFDYYDETAEHRQLLAALASVNIVATSLSVLIALIAVVNMVNVLATGILNRRGELAALQCVGMTEKDLRKMTLIESLQYALTSGIAAIAVCEALMLLTKVMIKPLADLDNFDFLNSAVSYIQPLPIILAASICAFAVAAVTSMLALSSARKTSLVEQIRQSG